MKIKFYNRLIRSLINFKFQSLKIIITSNNKIDIWSHAFISSKVELLNSEERLSHCYHYHLHLSLLFHFYRFIRKLRKFSIQLSSENIYDICSKFALNLHFKKFKFWYNLY